MVNWMGTAHISHDLSCTMKINHLCADLTEKKTRDFQVILKKRNGISLRIKRNQKQSKVLNHYAVIILYSKKFHIFIAIKVIEPQDIWLGIVDDSHYSSDYKLKEIGGFFRGFFAISLVHREKKSIRRESSCEWHKSERIVKRNCPKYREGV